MVKSNLLRILVLWLAQNRMAEVFAETMFQLGENSSLIPDVSVVFSSRMSSANDWLQGAPEIAIEVVSSETAARLEQKIDLYLAHGAKSVWAVFPEHRVVRISDACGQSTKFQHNQTLDHPAALPGFSTPVTAIFEGI